MSANIVSSEQAKATRLMRRATGAGGPYGLARGIEAVGLIRLGAHHDFGEMMRSDCSVPILVNEGRDKKETEQK
jgi:hypothetical protein